MSRPVKRAGAARLRRSAMSAGQGRTAAGLYATTSGLAALGVHGHRTPHLTA